MKLKKITAIAAALSVATTAGLCAIGCGKDSATPTNTYEYDIPQDYCRTYYEVFVRSFADGNGDGIGDIRGLIDNLDYLNDGDDKTTSDLGINGIWMMPINSSPSYHKYDVTDYYGIDDEYGTIDDFKDLVKACDERGIWLQMDLVLNHTSDQHPWFREAIEEAKSGIKPEVGDAMKRYEIVRQESKPSGSWYNVPGTTDYWYLANFNTTTMPDVNLKNQSVREEIKKIVDYWLELGVRSFRLDAVPWACATSTVYNADNAEFWTWFNDYCNEKGAEVFGKDGDGIGRYCYNVGEVWAADSVVRQFFATGMSNFNYGMGGGPNVGFCDATAGWVGYKASGVVSSLEQMQADALDRDEHALLSNFLSNHDNNRSAGYLDYNATKIKTTAGLYLLAPGNPYIYYGEELGAAGSGKDENKRLAFNWGDSRNVNDPPYSDYTGEQKLGSQKKQTKDAKSVLTYYRKAIQLRNRFPEIGRGKMTGYAITADGGLKAMSELRGDSQNFNFTTVNTLNANVAVYSLTWNGRTVLIAQNISDQKAEFTATGFESKELVGELRADGGKVAFSGGKLSLDPGTVAVIK